MQTLESYDQVPYESFAIPETHPDALGCLANVLGLDAAPAEGCRVLELGAASGGNLIPMAWHLPGSEFTGIELSAEQSRRGQATTAALGLENCRLIHADIADLDPDPDQGLGQFDYILVHGVYSWVPESVREHILALCGGLLSGRGIAYVSWNVLPGWRPRAMVRDMLLHHCAGEARPGTRLAMARDLLARVAAGLEGDERPEGLLVRREIDYLRGARDSYLYHEYLEETNAPELFSQFMARAHRHGLAYLADTRLHSLFPSSLGAAAEAVLEPLPTQEETEQMMDFLSMRPFRRSLLVREGRGVVEEIDLGRLASLSLYADLEPADAGPERDAGVFTNGAGTSFRVSDPLTRGMLDHLAGIYPNAVPFADLVHLAHERLARTGAEVRTDDAEQALAELFNLYCSGGIGLTARKDSWTRLPGDRPRATPLARVQAAAGEGHVATGRHRVLSLDALAARLLMLLDGARDRDELTESLHDALRETPDLAPTLAADAPGTREAIAANIERLLGRFGQGGLLEAA
jgi:methyltransferase-like protein